MKSVLLLYETSLKKSMKSALQGTASYCSNIASQISRRRSSDLRVLMLFITRRLGEVAGCCRGWGFYAALLAGESMKGGNESYSGPGQYPCSIIQPREILGEPESRCTSTWGRKTTPKISYFKRHHPPQVMGHSLFELSKRHSLSYMPVRLSKLPLFYLFTDLPIYLECLLCSVHTRNTRIAKIPIPHKILHI